MVEWCTTLNILYWVLWCACSQCCHCWPIRYSITHKIVYLLKWFDLNMASDIVQKHLIENYSTFTLTYFFIINRLRREKQFFFFNFSFFKSKHVDSLKTYPIFPSNRCFFSAYLSEYPMFCIILVSLPYKMTNRLSA